MNDIEESCGNCRFYFGSTAANKGLCKRNPPEECIESVLTIQPQGTSTFYYESRYPKTSRFEWCGEWQYKNAQPVNKIVVQCQNATK